MASARGKSQRTSASPAVAALSEIVRLLARQAARELAEQAHEGNQSPKPDLSENRS
jgi:hypothetical protein